MEDWRDGRMDDRILEYSGSGEMYNGKIECGKVGKLFLILLTR